MKEKLLNFTFCLFSFLAIFFIFKNNKEVASIIIDAVNLFFKRVFVSLFPMFILNDILIFLNIPYYFYLIFNQIFLKVFHTSGIGAYIIFMSLISGTPSNAYILKELTSEKKISVEEASHFLSFTYFSNPLFLMTMLNLIFPATSTFKIIAIHYLSNLIIGIILRKKAPQITANTLKKEAHNGGVLSKSINKSMMTLLIILGTVTFYMLLTYIITSLISTTPLTKTLISGFLEITNGLNNLKDLEIALKIKEIIAVSIISFGGLSIHTQVKSILEDTQMSYHQFLKGRVMQTIISASLILFF